MFGRMTPWVVPAAIIVVMLAAWLGSVRPKGDTNRSAADSNGFFGDPSFDYQYDKSSNQGLYGIVGTDTWPCGPSEERMKELPNARVYLCQVGKPDAMLLQVPQIDGSNKNVTKITRPLFVDEGRWLCAIIHGKEKGQAYLIAWEVATGRPFMIGSFDNWFEARNRVATAYLANYGQAVANTNPERTVLAETDTIAIPDIATWRRDCRPE